MSALRKAFIRNIKVKPLSLHPIHLDYNTFSISVEFYSRRPGQYFVKNLKVPTEFWKEPEHTRLYLYLYEKFKMFYIERCLL